MPRSLVIVESPAKAKTINKYLGKEYLVKASLGHIKDLPKNRLGVDIEKGFLPQYEIIRGKGKIVTELKRIAQEIYKSGGNIFLAQDPDREGEAIAWHIAEEVNGKRDNIYRVLFHEITRDAIREAMKHPRRLDKNKYDAQIARRVLDRLVGYQVSPILWEKVKRGLSAGRVQSVALRLICEREKEIRAFTPEEYWSIIGEFLGSQPPSFHAKLVKIGNKKAELKKKEDAQKILDDMKDGEFKVDNVEIKERKKNPPPPFITSTLQQEAARKLRFSVKKTMMVAQQLYEGVELGTGGATGLITYMRTDSTRLSSHAVTEARRFIKTNLGAKFLPQRPRVYPNRKSAQDAHEAIRPTDIDYTPQSIGTYLTKDQYNLYKLIWNRFIACQMNPAIIDRTNITIKVDGKDKKGYLFKATGSVVRFSGYTKIYVEGSDDENKEEGESLPPLNRGQILRLLKLDSKQHFTQPQPRYSESSLVKALELNGIGRPSTYAVILGTIQERGYVHKEKGRFVPTELGMIVTDLLIENFPKILNVDFTARMEDDLDNIEEGRASWRGTIEGFYRSFKEQLEKARKEMRELKKEETPTEMPCERCGAKMVIRWGKRGRFLACPNYPDCINTKDITIKDDGTIEIMEKRTVEECPNCGKPMVIKEGRYGRFLSCSSYPECKTTKPLPVGVNCPSEGCNGVLVERRTKKGRTFYGCSNFPDCQYAIWDKPIAEECPECGHPFLVEKSKRRRPPMEKDEVHPITIECPNKECSYTLPS